MKKLYCKGQVSIYLCIILMSIFGLATLLVDIARISAGNALVKKAVQSAARSSLAEYCTKLKENYGIFSLSPEKCNEVEESVRKYLQKNLEALEKNGVLDLYDFKVEEVKVTPTFNLSENEIFKQQILEYMKFRAPKELTEGFVERLRLFKDSGKMSEAYNKKVAIDKMAGKMDKTQQKLKMNIDGAGVHGEKFINNFNRNNCLTEAFDRYQGFYSKYKALESEAAGIEIVISGLNSELMELNNKEKVYSEKTIVSESSKEKNEKSKEESKNEAGYRDEINEIKRKKKEINNKLNTFINTKNELYGAVNEAKLSMKKLLDMMQNDLTEPYMRLNKDGIANVKNILDAGEKISIAIGELEVFLEGNFGISNPYLSDFLKTAESDLGKLKRLLLGGEKAHNIILQFQQNSNVLRELAFELQTASGFIDGSTGSIEQVSERINSLVQKYDNKISYSYEKPDKGNKKDDPRSGKAEAVKLFLQEKLFNDKNFVADGIKLEDLPSNKKIKSASFDIEDSPYLLKAKDAEVQSNDNSEYDAGSSSETDNFGDKVDLYNEEGMFQENTFSCISSMCSGLSDDIGALRDNIYINEYIMGTFKNAVLKIGNGTETADDVDLRGKSKKLRDTFFDCEVEYILHGNSSQNKNKITTASQLLLIRFGLDTLHVYTDAKKKELAVATASAVAGWWTGGAGIPVISNLIMCGWGMGEALIDAKDLLDGKKVPVYKSKGDWKLDIGIPKGGQKTDSKMAFSYHDYLRLFLLITNEKSKLGRMEDLIQLNMGKDAEGFNMSGCNTYVRIEAEVSMKYLFATQPFMPAKVKTADGRHRFRILVYEGY